MESLGISRSEIPTYFLENSLFSYVWDMYHTRHVKNRGRMVIVGEENVGKTTLLHNILGSKYTEGIATNKQTTDASGEVVYATDGIDIHRFVAPQKDFILSIWGTMRE